MRTTSTRLAVAAMLFGMLLVAPAHGKKADTNPGTYEDWNEDIARVEIKQTFKLADFSEVRVALDTSATPLPDKDDNAHEPVVKVLKDATSTLVTGMQEELESPAIKVETAPTSEAPLSAASPVLQVRVRIVRMNPGSRSARFFGSFGAGKSSVEIEGEIVDGTSNTVLLSFATQRSSGGMTKFGGGSYEKLLTGDLSDLGTDIGAMLTLFK
jgi:hypothetical protein